jgi:uncharacterized protein YegL
MNLENKQKNIDMIIILDESGSMKSMGNEPIQSINEFIENQKITCIDGNITIVTFNNRVNIKIDKMSLKNFTNFQDYSPNGMTALNDAICATINKEILPKNILTCKNKILLIITDGEENASIMFNHKNTKKLIKLVENKYNWKVLYLGANQDSFSISSQMNINQNRCSNFNSNLQGNLLQICRSTSESVSKYRVLSSNGIKSDINLNILSNHIKINNKILLPIKIPL